MVTEKTTNHLNLPVALWRMARPLMLVSILLVYLFGALVAVAEGAAFRVFPFVWGAIALLCVSTSIHYINEYADYETDLLARRTPFSGGSGALPAGLAPRQAALGAAWAALSLGMLAGAVGYLSGLFNLLALLVLVAGSVGGWMYSAFPLKLAWHGLGEVDNAILGGMLLPIYGYVIHVGTLSWKHPLIFLPFMLLVFGNLLATTWADRHADAAVGKWTLATLMPAGQLRLLYLSMLMLALGAQGVLVLCGLPPIIAFSPLPALALMVWGMLTYTRLDSPHPSVIAMMGFLLTQMVGWWLAAHPQ